jgi:hypothetical protein
MLSLLSSIADISAKLPAERSQQAVRLASLMLFDSTPHDLLSLESCKKSPFSVDQLGGMLKYIGNRTYPVLHLAKTFNLDLHELIPNGYPTSIEDIVDIRNFVDEIKSLNAYFADEGAKVLGIDFEQEMTSLDMAGKLERIKSLAVVGGSINIASHGAKVLGIDFDRRWRVWIWRGNWSG